MTRILDTLGDRMLSRLLPRTTAGACVPEAGDACGCKRTGSHCVDPNVRVIIFRRHFINCLGSCVSGDVICDRKYVVDSSC